jgi:Tfp pilus assembly protein PilW
MKSMRLLSRAFRRRSGFTIGEMMVYMVIAAIVLASIYRVMMRQGRGYSQQTAAMDADESARGAGAVLAWDIRHAAMAGDELLSLASDSIVVRSVQGVGVVCAKNSGGLAQYGVWKTGGNIEATTADTAMIFRVATSTWKSAKLTGVSTGTAYGVGTCSWTGGRVPDLAIQLATTVAADTVGITVGSPLRAYRSVTYKAFSQGGRWWLGRRIGPTGAFEKLTGPLIGSAGLSFTYHTSTGAVTTTPTAVATVKFKVLTQSYKQYRDASGALVYRYDSLSSAVALRR